MREDLERIYGAELRWLRRLSLRDRCRIVWFVVSMCLVMMAGDGSLPALMAVYTNAVVSAWQLRRVNINKRF